MSTPNWTPAQKAAIEDRGGALLVSAAAGSGKTAVLTERAVRLITDPERPLDADRLLIVTFTNAAAAELRARIGEALFQRSLAQPGSAWLRRQRMLLQRAPICTIDAFCLDLLRRYFQALDIPPDFTPADPGSVQTLRAAALADTLEQAYQDPDFCAFADLYGKGRTDRAAGEAILQVYDFLRALPDYRRRLEDYLAPWQAENGFSSTGWHDLLLAEAARCARAGGELVAAALADCKMDFAQAQLDAAESKKTPAAKEKAVRAENERFAEPLERLEAAQQLLGRVARLAEGGQWEDLYDLLTPYVLGMNPLPGLKGMKKRLAGEHKNAVKTRAEEAAGLFGQILELIPCSLAEAETDRQAALPRLRALFAAVRDFDDRFTAKKRERKLLEFSDFEHLALRLLRGEDGQPTPLCGEIRAGFGAVMVDEYQDTNALQDAIYRCLASPSGDNRFLVGDLKQSIYRFRQADPSIFREKLDSWPLLPGGLARPRPAEGTEGENALLNLDANFRSAPGVVAGVNYFFEQLMSPELGDTAYGDGQRLVCGAPGEYTGGVEAQFLPDDTPETDAAWIADRIAALVAEGFPVRSGGSTRLVQYQDCCILLAARGDFAAYTSALEARGIPVYADTRENLMEAAHIRPLIALLRVIDNPAQDVYLAAAMLGPLFGFTEDDLVRLRAARRKTSLYGAVVQLAQQEDPDPFAEKIRIFYERLRELRRLSHSVPMERLLEEIFASTGYLAALGAMPDGIRRREDARRFAAFCAGTGAGGVPALVRAIDAAEAAGGETGQDTTPGSARPGCVTIMTIHRSKGLEFPVVFVANTSHQFNQSDAIRPVLTHSRLGVGVMLRAGQTAKRYKTLPYAALAQAIRTETLSEEMRVLYVALTRAQDALIVTIPLKKTDTALKTPALCAAAEATGPEAMQGMNNWAGWLLTAVLLHPNSDELWAHTALLPHHLPDQTPLTVQLLPVPEAAGETEAPAVQQQDEALRQAVEASFRWKNPRTALQKIPAKVSVSAVAHAARPVALERPAFLQKGGMTGAERGTAIHAFMQSVPFDGPAPDLQAEVQRQKDRKLLDPALADKLDLERVQPFFESSVWRRIRAARRVLREEPFITALPAARVTPEAAGCEAEVLVQGIADLVLVFDDHAEICDYKTDASRDPDFYKKEYAAQLQLYRHAFALRLGVPVTRLTIYSFTLQQEIDIPLQPA